MVNKLAEYTAKSNSIYFHHSLTDADHSTMYHVPELHAHYELFFLMRGIVEYVVEGNTYKVNEGDILLVDYKELHSLNIDLSTDYERIVLQFGADIVPANSLELGWLVNVFSKRRIFLAKNVRLTRIESILVELATACNEDKRFLPALFSAAVLNIMVELNKLATDASVIEPISTNSLTQRINSYISANLARPFSLDELAHDLFISKYYMCHCFKRDMKISLHKYINYKRIVAAAELINSNKIPPMQAAGMVGFQHYTTFINNYKQIMGTLPSEYLS